MRANSLKSAGASRQEQARLEVENAEDDLVQKTEVAIGLMKTVLDNVCRADALFIHEYLTHFTAGTHQGSQRADQGSGTCPS